MIDSKQAIELLAKKIGIRCEGKEGCHVIGVLNWDEVREIGQLIQLQDEHLRDAAKKISKFERMFDRAVYELADNALTLDCPPFDKESDQLCDSEPVTPETCRNCWKKYFESEVADEDTDDRG